MEIPENVLQRLRCDQCNSYLSCGPVYLQNNETSICGRCSLPKDPVIRNKSYEALAEVINFPCTYQENGCNEKLHYSQNGQPHETVCKYRPLVCPVTRLGDCEWTGNRYELLDHCQIDHPQRVVTNPCTLTHDISQSSESNFLLVAFNVLFLLHTKICIITRKICYSLRYLGHPDEAANFKYTLNIKKDNCSLSYSESVAPEGCRAIQENTSIINDINTLLGVLKGFEGATFNVSVQNFLHGITKNDECANNCGSYVTEHLYRNNNGWFCEECLPKSTSCENCDCIDIPNKILKHENLYCEHDMYCYICSMSISNCTLFEHFQSEHTDRIIKQPYRWRFYFINNWKWSLICSHIGYIICQFGMSDLKYVIRFYTPLQSKELRKYEFNIKFQYEKTEKILRTSSIVRYDEVYDWEIEIDKKYFSADDHTFLIALDISEKQ